MQLTTNFCRVAGGLGMLYVTEGYITNVQGVEEGPEKVAATGRCYRSMRKGALNACCDFCSGSDNYGQHLLLHFTVSKLYTLSQ